MIALWYKNQKKCIKGAIIITKSITPLSTNSTNRVEVLGPVQLGPGSLITRTESVRRKATLKRNVCQQSCVKVEVVVLDSPSLIVRPYGLRGRGRKKKMNSNWCPNHYAARTDSGRKAKMNSELTSWPLRHSYGLVLNWANVCSPNILRTVRRTMILFLIELLVRRTWFGQFGHSLLVQVVMRCKLRPELAADAQQTAWSKM